VADSTSVNFYRLAAAALDARPDRRVVVTDRANFPTDRYVLESLAAARDLEVRRLETDPVEGVSTVDVEAALDGGVALVTFSAVDYRSAALADVAAITALSHAAGALVLSDVSHAAGAVPLALEGRRCRPRGGLHVQVRQRRAGRPLVPLRPARPPRDAAEPDPGVVRAASGPGTTPEDPGTTPENPRIVRIDAACVASAAAFGPRPGGSALVAHGCRFQRWARCGRDTRRGRPGYAAWAPVLAARESAPVSMGAISRRLGPGF